MTNKPPDSAEEQSKAVVPKLRFVTSPDGVAEIYANFIDASWTQYDVRIRLAQVISQSDQPGSTEFVAEERAAITMSWPNLKLVNLILAELVKQFEATNGEIPKPRMPGSG